MGLTSFISKLIRHICKIIGLLYHLFYLFYVYFTYFVDQNSRKSIINRWLFFWLLQLFPIIYEHAYCDFFCILRRLWRLYGLYRLYILNTYHFTITGFILHYTFIPIMTITLIISSTWERLITWGVYAMIACRFVL